jgi:F1F0 ATPase subunit 2
MDLDGYAIALSLAGGFAAGFFFFGGLYLTTQMLPRARRPGLLVFASLTVRTIIFGGGAWLVAAHASVLSLVAYMVGAIIVRVLLVGYVRRPETTPSERP